MMVNLLLSALIHAVKVSTSVISHGPRNGVNDNCFQVIIGGLVVKLLLILAGDIEVNPGPVSAEELTTGLASLITEAPTSVKPVLGVWAPDKENMVTEWNSTKFTVPLLREALAWLYNTTAEDIAKKFKKKLDVASELPIAIECLIPEECGGCQTKYTVGRSEKPTLQCAGCHQGIHEVCLREVLGEGAATLLSLHGRARPVHLTTR